MLTSSNHDEKRTSTLPTMWRPHPLQNIPGENYCYFNAVAVFIFQFRTAIQQIISISNEHDKKAKLLEESHTVEPEAEDLTQDENPVPASSTQVAHVDIDEEEEEQMKKQIEEARGTLVKVWCSIAQAYYSTSEARVGAASNKEEPIPMQVIRSAVSLLSDKVYAKGIMQDAPEFYEFFIALLIKEVNELLPQRRRGRGNGAKRGRSEGDVLEESITYSVGEEWACQRAECKDQGQLKHVTRTDPLLRVRVYLLMEVPADPFDYCSFGRYIRMVLSGNELSESRTCPTCGEGVTLTSRVERLPTNNVTLQLTWHKVPDTMILKRLLLEIFEDNICLTGAFGRAMGEPDEDDSEDNNLIGRRVVTTPSKKSIRRGQSSKKGVLSGIVCFRNRHYVSLILGQADTTGSRHWYVCEDAHQPLHLGPSWLAVVSWLHAKHFAPLLLTFDVCEGVSNPSPRPSLEDINKYITKSISKASTSLIDDDDVSIVSHPKTTHAPQWIQKKLTSLLPQRPDNEASSTADPLASRIQQIRNMLGPAAGNEKVLRDMLVRCNGNVQRCIDMALGNTNTPTPITIPRNTYAPSGNAIKDAYESNFRYTNTIQSPRAQLPPNGNGGGSNSNVASHAAKALGKSQYPQTLFNAQYYIHSVPNKEATKAVIERFGGSIISNVSPTMSFGTAYVVVYETRIVGLLHRFLDPNHSAKGDSERVTSRNPAALPAPLANLIQSLPIDHVLSNANFEIFSANNGKNKELLQPIAKELATALKRAALEDKPGAKKHFTLYLDSAPARDAGDAKQSPPQPKEESSTSTFIGRAKAAVKKALSIQ